MSNEWAVKMDKPVTRKKAEAMARSRAADPDTVVEVVQPGFNADPVSGGFAFSSDRGLLMVDLDGGWRFTVTSGDHDARSATIEQWWRQIQHRNRPLGLDDISGWHRAAITALVSGHDSVADLPAEHRPDVTDTAVADYLFVFLRRHAEEPTQEAALRALARADWLLEPPKEHERAHPCPLCGRPAIGKPWVYVSVCDICYPKTACLHDCIVAVFQGSIDVEARHVDDDTECEPVTRTGIVTVDGHECHMGEANLGGIFVGVLPSTPE